MPGSPSLLTDDGLRFRGVQRHGEAEIRRPAVEQSQHAEQATRARHRAGHLPPRFKGTAGLRASDPRRGRRGAARAYGKCSPAARARRPRGGGERLRERARRAGPMLPAGLRRPRSPGGFVFKPLCGQGPSVTSTKLGRSPRSPSRRKRWVLPAACGNQAAS